MSADITQNHRLALALGWTNIAAVDGSLLGTPPGGAPNSRGQALIPNWTGDNAAALLLMCNVYVPDHFLSASFANTALERINFNNRPTRRVMKNQGGWISSDFDKL